MNGLLTGYGAIAPISQPGFGGAPVATPQALSQEQLVTKAAENYIMGSMVTGIIVASALGGAAIWTVAAVRFLLKRRK